MKKHKKKKKAYLTYACLPILCLACARWRKYFSKKLNLVRWQTFPRNKRTNLSYLCSCLACARSKERYWEDLRIRAIQRRRKRKSIPGYVLLLPEYIFFSFWVLFLLFFNHSPQWIQKNRNTSKMTICNKLKKRKFLSYLSYLCSCLACAHFTQG